MLSLSAKDVIAVLACYCVLAKVPAGCSAQTPAPVAASPQSPNIAYMAVYNIHGVPPYTLYYDHGKYSIFGPATCYLYDGTDTFLRWHGNLTAHTAQLDAGLALERLGALIKREGLEAASHKSGIDRSLLERYLHIWIPNLQPRVLSHPLPVFVKEQPEFLMRKYKKSGSEQVAGVKCDVLVSQNGLNDKLWVETTTKCILRQHTTYPSDNPRIPPRIVDWEVSQFRLLPYIPLKQFRIPSGFTVTLPTILRDLPLPVGVHRKLLEGKNSFTGFDIADIVDSAERHKRSEEERQRYLHSLKKEGPK